MIQRAHDSDPDKPKRKKRTATPDSGDEGQARAVFLDGALIAEEFGRTPGWFLFLTHRSAQVWAMARAKDRGGLFTVRAHAERMAELMLLDVDAELRRPLLVLTDLLADPERADPARVAGGCREVAAWAAGREKFDTALLFAEVAALILPGDARVLYETGRYARQGASYHAAAKWLGAALEVGRKTGDWESYCLALGGLGVMHQKRGNLRLARRFHMRCLRAAEKHELPVVAGEAAHDLFIVAAEMEKPVEAERWARMALQRLKAGHPRLPMFAHDLAFFWFQRGDHVSALRVFQALLPHFSRPAERILVLSSIARAAGSVGQKREFEMSSQETLAMVESAAAIELAAQSLLDLARGAADLRQWDLAERSARRAFEVARQRKEGKVQIEAEELVSRVERERSQSIAPAASADASDTHGVLADAVVRALSTSAAG